MGADGHHMMMRREDWDKDFSDVKPEDCGIYPATILGIKALSVYWDTEGRDFGDYGKQGLAENLEGQEKQRQAIQDGGTDGVLVVSRYGGPYGSSRDVTLRLDDTEKRIATIEANPDLPYSKRCKEAADWFLANAEDRVVWT